jgi:hypothetical protein
MYIVCFLEYAVSMSTNCIQLDLVKRKLYSIWLAKNKTVDDEKY